MKLFICLLALVATAMSESNEELLKASIEQFTAKMFQELVNANPGQNFVSSPSSVLILLAQLSLASVGDSHDEIQKAIGLPNDKVTKEVFTSVTKELRSVKGVELYFTNILYASDGSALLKPLIDLSRDFCNSVVKNVDFSQNDAAAHEINTWVEDNTNHRIKNLVDPKSLDGFKSAVLVNAINFKGKWQKPFDKSSTEDRDFHVSKDETIKIPTMYKYDNFKYGESEELDAKLIELPYEGGESSLLVVLPKKIGSIDTFVEKLGDPSVLPKAVENMSYNEVIVELPKFKIETTTDLGAVLKKMNVINLFPPSPTQLEKLIIERHMSHILLSAAVHKAYIEVNEEGSEAAAADVSMGGGSSYEYNPDQKILSVDKPFYFELKVNNRSTFNGIFRK